MALITIPYIFSAGAVIIASQHNSNFSTISTDYNGNITNDNISASAAIVDTKLAQITTSSKVSVSAITGTLGTSNGGTGSTAAANAASGVAVYDSSGNLVIVTDVYTNAWADYSASSTIVGWTSFSTKQIYTSKIGKRVFVNINIDGTSNSVNTTCTLPYTAANTNNFLFAYVSDNGGTSVSGLTQLSASSSTVIFSPTISAGAGTWTNSGSKQVHINFTYQST